MKKLPLLFLSINPVIKITINQREKADAKKIFDLDDQFSLSSKFQKYIIKTGNMKKKVADHLISTKVPKTPLKKLNVKNGITEKQNRAFS